MKVLLAGGGSGGSVSPALAVAEEIRKLKPKTEFLFVGTRGGPERNMVEKIGIKFISIPAAKWRRYFSLRNLFSPIILAAGLIKATLIVYKFRPQVAFSAGGFVGVPVCWAAKIFGAKIIIHQQDARIGLANKLVSAFAHQITTAFKQTAKEFYSGSGLFEQKLKPRAEWVGNPVRRQLLDGSKVDIKQYFQLSDQPPILLILGGATGAKQINQLVEKIVPELVINNQIIHQTGAGKNNLRFQNKNYHPFELIPFDAYAAILKAAHLVIARAGLSTLAELSVLGKPAIIIPMPGTHQEDNAKILKLTHSAIVLLGQEAEASSLLQAINKVKFNPELSKKLSINVQELMPLNSAEKIAKIIIGSIKHEL